MTIVIVLGVALVVIYFFLSANGVKLFKKEHKVKAKKSNEEKYEEVLPKEKKEKKEKNSVVKISDVAKKEKLKEDIKKELDAKTSSPVKKEGGGGTVTKITKEDFLKNNIEVPSTSNLLTDEEKKAMTAKSLPKAKEQPSKPYDFGLPDFDSPMSSKSFPADDLSQSKDDPFADIDFDAILNGTSSTKPEDILSGLDGFDMPDFGESSAGSKAPKQKFSQKNSTDYFNSSPSFNMSDQAKFGGNPVEVKSLNERFEQVFGSNFEAMGGTEAGKEILIGDILSGPRARENRLRRSEREKRQKWM